MSDASSVSPTGVGEDRNPPPIQGGDRIERGGMMQIGSIVRIKENAFPASDDPRDIKARGQTGKIVVSLEQQLGPGWAGNWEIELDGEVYIVESGEIELAESTEAASETLADLGAIQLKRLVSVDKPRTVYTVIEAPTTESWIILDADEIAALRAHLLTWDENMLEPGTAYTDEVMLEDGSVVSEWQPDHDK